MRRDDELVAIRLAHREHVRNRQWPGMRVCVCV